MKLDDQAFHQLLRAIPLLAVDGVLIKNQQVLLLRRRDDPFRGSWVLPGGFLKYGESLEEGVAREFREETKLLVRVRSMVNIYSHPHRDPRGHVVAAAYLCDPLMVGDLSFQIEQNESLGLFPVDGLPSNIGFDHAKMIVDAVKLKEILERK